jgi:hypothetical protein
MEASRPSLSAFEHYAANGQSTAALSEAFDILHAIDTGFGTLSGIVTDEIGHESNELLYANFAGRFLTALDRLILEPRFGFGPDEFEYFVMFRPWLDVMRLADPTTNSAVQERWSASLHSRDALRKFLILAPPEALMEADLDAIWREHSETAAFAFCAYLNSRALFTEPAYAFRERLLEWLPARLVEVDLRIFAFGRLLESYMLASYATTPRKHEIKSALIAQIVHAAAQAGFAPTRRNTHRAGTPTVVVVNEFLSANHSMYRTHSRSIAALRERFHVVGFVLSGQLHSGLKDIFDECVSVPETDLFSTLRFAVGEIQRRNPDALFYPSVGMTLHGISLSALRLAPVQIASYGHAASSQSAEMDYMIVPEDFAGDASSFSETVVRLPPAAMPFVMRSGLNDATQRIRPSPADRVRIAIPSVVMKLNSRLFSALHAIETRATHQVEFHFFSAQMRGITTLALRNALRELLPAAIILDESDFETYMARLRDCDFFLSPFPYGNTNGIVDAVFAGLPGVCLDGPQPHEHIDAGLFARAGFPPELIAHSVDDYVAAALRMVDDPAWLRHCREVVARCDRQRAFFDGNPTVFCDAVARLVQAKAADLPR